MYRATYCARTGPLPLLPSGPGGVGGIAPRRTRHTTYDTTVKMQGCIPVSHYLSSSYEPDAEYVDGEIEPRPAALYDHASWQAAILQWFAERSQQGHIRAVPSLRVRVAETRYRVPDVTVLDRNKPIEQILTHAPVAVFEILSPEDSMMRVTRKLSDYAAMGIQHIWVIDPGTKKTWRYHENELKLSPKFEEAGEKIYFDFAEIEKLLD